MGSAPLEAPDGRNDRAPVRALGDRTDLHATEATSRLAARKVIHDMRNILACAQLLSDQFLELEDPTVRRLAPKLAASLDRAIALCARTRNEGTPWGVAPNRQRLALAPLVEEVAGTLDLDHGEIRWTNAVAATVEIDADPDDLFRALLNLCGNAVLALEGPGVRPKEIRVDGWRDGAVCTLEVRDTGLGVPETARLHLFQASRGSTRFNGSGLGLAIAAELIRAHGGEISLVPGGAQGACFRIAIPDGPAEAGRDADACVAACSAAGTG